MTEREAVAPERLGAAFARGVAWSAVARTLSQTIAWASTLYVARYLSASDYGLFGLAMLYLAFLQLVADLGLGTAVLANRHLTDEDLPQINGLARLGGLAGTLLVIVTSPLLGIFFRAPQLPILLVALSPTFFVNSFRTVPQTLLQREFRFKWLAILDATQGIMLAALNITLARAGFGYWTLAIAALVSSVVNTAVVVARRPVPAAWPSLARLRTTLSFSTQVVLQRVAWYISSNADFVVAGRVLGQSSAGEYMLAWNFANAPLERVGNLILAVSPSVLGAARGNLAALRKHVLQATQMIAWVVFPMCVGMALVARPFITHFLGIQWAPSVVPMQMLAAYTAVRSLVPLFGQLLLVVNEEHYATRLMFINIVVMTTAFLIGASVGSVNGIAVAYLIAHPFVASAYVARALERIEYPKAEFFREGILPPLICTLVMAAGVTVVARLAVGMPLGVGLLAQIIAGVVSYTAIAIVLFGHRVSALMATSKLRPLAEA